VLPFRLADGYGSHCLGGHFTAASGVKYPGVGPRIDARGASEWAWRFMGDQPGVLPRRYRPISTATAVEEKFARAFIGCDIIFDLLSRIETHPSSQG
jgi:hypothetical protein